jgi:zinc transport system ATP-binding protein
VSTPQVELRDGAVGYADRPVIAGIDLRIDPGEVVALVGPNGCGKSTLVRGLVGLARVMHGELELFGTPADRFAERARIGYVPQRHTVGGAVPSTVAEVVSSGRFARKRLSSWLNARDRDVVQRAIETAGLAERSGADVATLSGGQQRRVLIARALASEPELLIMDEPTAGVDYAAQQLLAGTLGRLADAGLTLLIVSHELGPLLPLFTRVVAMDHGRIVHDGSVDVALARGLALTHHAPSRPDPR